MPALQKVISSWLLVHRRKQPALATNYELRTTNRKGFTLIELMVVIAIIAVLASVGLIIYSSAQKSGRISKRVQDLNALRTAVELYKSATGAYPPQNGWACISTGLAPLVTGGYMPVLPADPLDNGNAAGANCYEYTTGASGSVTSEYKIRTKSSIYGTNGEMDSLAFGQQRALIDPAKDGVADCNVVPSPGPVQAWAVYSGTAVCDD